MLDAGTSCALSLHLIFTSITLQHSFDISVAIRRAYNLSAANWVGVRNSLCAIGPYGCAVWAIVLKFSAFVKNRSGYKMTLTAIFLQFFFLYMVTITDHFGPNYVHQICKERGRNTLIFCIKVSTRMRKWKYTFIGPIFLKLYPSLWMTYQFIPIFLVEFKFLHDFFIDDTNLWEILVNLFSQCLKFDYLDCMFAAVFFITSMKIQVHNTKWAKI